MDGRSTGLTAPHGQAQSDVIRAAWDAAGATQDEFGYIEAHGTGTALGDPVEYEALTEVLTGGPGPDGHLRPYHLVGTEVLAHRALHDQ
ncbi:hypothetical protein ACH4GZ_22940 [Streptomyces hygroscopicus]|uniref:hypothetical protein n=1 Tax=Streptomyces hygroscopicus TaxID=1912 RepID=UPI0037988788